MKFGKILRLLAVLVFSLAAPRLILADSFSYAPDTLTFSPSGQDSLVSYVRLSYNGDSTGAGTYIHAWVSSGSSYFSVSADTLHITKYSYIRVVYHVASNTVTGQLSISDDTVTRTVVLIGRPNPASADGELNALGPYFPENTPEGRDTCTPLRLINSGSDADTIWSAGFSHDPQGIFSWDSASLPLVLGAHDTLFWDFCFHAPQNTNQYTDTFTVKYRDAYSSTRSIWRFVTGKAVDTTPPDNALKAVGPYFPGNVPEGGDTCLSKGAIWPLVLINGGSDLDTVESISWTHDPGSMFSLDLSGTSFPFTIASGDTMYWTACFHAPSDTVVHWDTLMIRYRDAYSNDRYVTRIVYARAVDTTVKTCYNLYVKAAPVTNIGDTSFLHLYISNRLDSSVTLTSIHISGTDDGAFRVDSSGFPNTIAGHAYDSVWLKFIPNRTSGSTSYAATLTASFTSNDTAHCHEATVALSGSMPQSCSDTETVHFDTTGASDVALTGDSDRYYAHRIDFVNTSSVTLVVTAVNWLHSSTHFLVSQVVPSLPDTLAPNDGMAIIVHFYGDSSGTIYLDTLALTVTAGIADPTGKISVLSANGGTYYVNIKGISNTIQAGVTSPEANIVPALRVYPNPASGLVNIELPGSTNATFEVIDLLGHVIATHRGSESWQWDSSTLSRNGTYFIRASDGTRVSTERLVLER